jgi:rubrerythrin
MDLLWFVLLILLVGGFSILVGSARGRDDLRMRRRGESTFEAETRRQVHTDATGMLMCRSCGAAASERAGRCPSCGAVL